MRTIDIYKDARGYFSGPAARNIQEADRLCRGEFIGTVYCDHGHIREPFNDTLVHELDGEPRWFDVGELLERVAKPPVGLRFGLDPWASQPPPYNTSEEWIGRILSPPKYTGWVGLFRVWERRASGLSEDECEAKIRRLIGLWADEPLPAYVSILPPSPVDAQAQAS